MDLPKKANTAVNFSETIDEKAEIEKARSKEYYVKNKEWISKKRAEYRAKNKKKLVQKQKIIKLGKKSWVTF